MASGEIKAPICGSKYRALKYINPVYQCLLTLSPLFIDFPLLGYIYFCRLYRLNTWASSPHTTIQPNIILGVQIGGNLFVQSVSIVPIMQQIRKHSWKSVGTATGLPLIDPNVSNKAKPLGIDNLGCRGLCSNPIWSITPNPQNKLNRISAVPIACTFSNVITLEPPCLILSSTIDSSSFWNGHNYFLFLAEELLLN